MARPVVPSIAAKYYVELLDKYCARLATFDTWEALEIVQQVNGVGSYKFAIPYTDTRKDKFELDGRIYVHRSVPNAGLSDHVYFRGMHRSQEKRPYPERTYTSVGVDYNHLLARREIRYKAGTVNADKNDVAESVMCEYVDENCGHLATVSSGRLSNGVMPSFVVGPTTSYGSNWSGSRAFRPLLDVLIEIANKHYIDFMVEPYGAYGFMFRTYPGQLGLDRTDVGMGTNPEGDYSKNSAGNVPVTFAIMRGNVSQLSYVQDRINEGNSVSVLGKGEGSTQTVVVLATTAKDDSPWNTLEFSRPASNQDYTYQLEDFGISELISAAAHETFDLVPLQQSKCLYELHYKLGDKVTVIDGDVKRYKRLMKVTTIISQNTEQLRFEFADIKVR